MAANADLAFVGVGNLRGPSSLRNRGVLSPKQIQELLDLGVVGDINLGFFTSEGKKADVPLSQKLVGLTLDHLRKMKRVIAVAGGEAKVEAITAMLRGRLAHVLVTDDITARALLQASGIDRAR